MEEKIQSVQKKEKKEEPKVDWQSVQTGFYRAGQSGTDTSGCALNTAPSISKVK